MVLFSLSCVLMFCQISLGFALLQVAILPAFMSSHIDDVLFLRSVCVKHSLLFSKPRSTWRLALLEALKGKIVTNWATACMCVLPLVSNDNDKSITFECICLQQLVIFVNWSQIIMDWSLMSPIYTVVGRHMWLMSHFLVCLNSSKTIVGSCSTERITDQVAHWIKKNVCMNKMPFEM